MRLDLKALGDAVVDVVREHVAKVAGALSDRLAALETAIANLPVAKDGEPGLKGDPGEPGLPGAPGEPGAPGDPGKSITLEDIQPLLKTMQAEWALDFERRSHDTMRQVIANMPKAKDGVDGLGFEDLTVTHDGARLLTIKFQRGEVVKEFPVTLPNMIYQGVFKEGESYEVGDVVTWAGSLWHCNEATSDKPLDGSKSWVLAAKRGNDGKSFVPKDVK